MLAGWRTSRDIARLLAGAEGLERSPQGEAARAREALGRAGPAALPALRSANARLTAEYEACYRQLKAGPLAGPLAEPGPFANYALKTEAQKRHRHVVATRQARVADVIAEIERGEEGARGE